MIRRIAGRVLAMLLLAAAGPALAQSTEADADLAPVPGMEAAPAAPAGAPAPAAPTAPSRTYAQKDVLSAAESVFGKGAAGVAKIIERVFQDLGQPNGYIEGREAGGAFIAGLRYGSGTLHHKIEGDLPVYWSGPSVGFDIGGDASKTFVLVYNLHDTEDMFRRYPAVEGKVYVVGGFTANYLQRDDVILVPIKLGVGWRLGANLGYVHFRKTSKLSPL